MYDVEPLHLHISYVAMTTHLRVGVPCKWVPKSTDPNHVGHITYVRKALPKPLLDVQLDRTKFHRDWSLPFKVEIKDGSFHPTWADWICFTDGSLKDQRSGAGAIIYSNKNGDTLGNEEIAALSNDHITTLCEGLKNSTVYQSELRAIEMTANWLLEKDIKSRKIDLFVDNQAALYSIKALSCRLQTVQKAREALISLGVQNIVKLTYDAAHKGIHGNEEADRVAKAATHEDPSKSDVPLAMANAKKLIREKIRKKWTQEWVAVHGHRQSKYFLSGPDVKFQKITKYGRYNIARLIRSITGHSYMKRHNNKVIKGDEDGYCRLCEEEDETPHHIITDCPVLLNRRNECFGARFLPELFTTWKVEDMINFLDSTELAAMDCLEGP